MAGTTGLEPATSDVTGRRSNQLNYVPAQLGQFHYSMAGGTAPCVDGNRPELVQGRPTISTRAGLESKKHALSGRGAAW